MKVNRNERGRKGKDERYRQTFTECVACVVASRQACTERCLDLVKSEEDPEYLQREREGKNGHPSAIPGVCFLIS